MEEEEEEEEIHPATKRNRQNPSCATYALIVQKLDAKLHER